MAVEPSGESGAAASLDPAVPAALDDCHDPGDTAARENVGADPFVAFAIECVLITKMNLAPLISSVNPGPA